MCELAWFVPKITLQRHRKMGGFWSSISSALILKTILMQLQILLGIYDFVEEKKNFEGASNEKIRKYAGKRLVTFQNKSTGTRY